MSQFSGGRLITGRLKGTPTSQILYRLASRTSKLGYFSIRYYPQNRTNDHKNPPAEASNSDAKEGLSEFESVVFLNDQILVSYIVPIARTSKSAVIRARLCRRLRAALQCELELHGPAFVPPQPMHLVFTPSMKVLGAPFMTLRDDVWRTYLHVKSAFESLPTKKKSAMTPTRHAGFSSTELEPLEKRRPELRGDFISERIIESTIANLPQSTYLDQFGGADVLLRRMRQSLKGEEVIF